MVHFKYFDKCISARHRLPLLLLMLSNSTFVLIGTNPIFPPLSLLCVYVFLFVVDKRAIHSNTQQYNNTGKEKENIRNKFSYFNALCGFFFVPIRWALWPTECYDFTKSVIRLQRYCRNQNHIHTYNGKVRNKNKEQKKKLHWHRISFVFSPFRSSGTASASSYKFIYFSLFGK